MSALPKDVAPNVRHTIDLCLQKDVKKRIARHPRRAALRSKGRWRLHRRRCKRSRRRTCLAPRAAGLGRVLVGAIVAGAFVWRTAAASGDGAGGALAVTRFVVTPPATRAARESRRLRRRDLARRQAPRVLRAGPAERPRCALCARARRARGAAHSRNRVCRRPGTRIRFSRRTASGSASGCRNEASFAWRSTARRRSR